MSDAKYIDIKKDFYKKFKREIAPLLNNIESERKQKYIITNLATYLSGLLCIFFLSNANIFCATLFGIILICTQAIFKKIFESQIKQKITPKICTIFNNMKWNEKEYEGRANLQGTNIFKPFHDINFNDTFSGNWEGVEYEIINCALSDKTKKIDETIANGAKTTIAGHCFYSKNGKIKVKKLSSVFDGVVIKLRLFKNFNGTTIVVPQTLTKNPPKGDLKHIKLENVEYLNKFDVYTDNENEANYLITSEFMEQIKNIKNIFRAKEIKCSFCADSLYIALSGEEDLFSICSLKNVLNDEKHFLKIFDEIISMIRMIDTLKSNERIIM